MLQLEIKAIQNFCEDYKRVKDENKHLQLQIKVLIQRIEYYKQIIDGKEEGLGE